MNGGGIENKVEDITINSCHLKNSKIRIKNSYNLFSSSIIAKVECGNCNIKYKKKLFYQRLHYFSADIELGCPNCKDIISISYEKIGTD